MGRQFPEQQIHHHLIHPILFITSMAVILALLTSLCAVWKKPTPTTQFSDESEEQPNTTAADNDQFAVASSETDEENEEKQKALPLPPGMATGTALPADYKKMRTKSMASISAAAAATSKKMTLSNLGNKVMQAKRENEIRHEDSLWKKRIILGDKCRGPNANNEEQEQESNSNVPKT